VAKDATEQLALRIIAILGMGSEAVAGRLNRRPRRNPKRTYARRLVQNLGDMPALNADRNADGIVLDLHRPPIVKLCLAHEDQGGTDLQPVRLLENATKLGC
jgi:hypothetical protein